MKTSLNQKVESWTMSKQIPHLISPKNQSKSLPYINFKANHIYLTQDLTQILKNLVESYFEGQEWGPLPLSVTSLLTLVRWWKGSLQLKPR